MRLFLLLLAAICIAGCATPTHTQQVDAAPRKISVLIVDGMNNHDWQRGTAILKETLESTGRFRVDVVTSPLDRAPRAEWENWHPQFANYDVVVNNFNGGYKPSDRRWSPAVEKDLENYVASGHGLVVVHAANNAFHDWPAYNDMIGLGWREPAFGESIVIEDGKIVRHPAGTGLKPGHPKERDMTMHLLEPHPITAGMPAEWLHPHEQLTHGQHGPAKNMTILTWTRDEDLKENEPMDWVVSHGKGRVYVTMQGHLWNDGPETAVRSADFETILARGVEWAATGKVTLPIPADFPTKDRASVRAVPTTAPAK